MNSENSKTFETHVLILNLTDKIDLTRGEKSVASIKPWSNLSIYYTWKNVKSSHNNKPKISAPTWYDGYQMAHT